MRFLVRPLFRPVTPSPHPSPRSHLTAARVLLYPYSAVARVGQGQLVAPCFHAHANAPSKGP